MSDAAWTPDQYLLAASYDQLQGLAWMSQNKDVPRAKRTKQPVPLRRPADERAAKVKDAAKVERAAAFARILSRV